MIWLEQISFRGAHFIKGNFASFDASVSFGPVARSCYSYSVNVALSSSSSRFRRKMPKLSIHNNEFSLKLHMRHLKMVSLSRYLSYAGRN